MSAASSVGSEKDQSRASIFEMRLRRSSDNDFFLIRVGCIDWVLSHGLSRKRNAPFISTRGITIDNEMSIVSLSIPKNCQTRTLEDVHNSRCVDNFTC